MRKGLIRALLLAIVIFAIPAFASADVVTTEDPAYGDAVYIAGNPDLYPIEYYDKDTKSYRGVLPDMYDKISERTGIDFAYIDAGVRNNQQRLAKNNQVEIVSAHKQGDIDSIADEYEFLSFDRDGKRYTICIGFTEVASDKTIGEIKKQIEAFDDDELVHIVLSEAEEKEARIPILIFVSIVILLLIVITVLTIIIMRGRRKEKIRRQNILTDQVTGIGNEEYFRYCFEHYISAASRSLYYVSYIAVDIEQINKYFGLAEAENLQKYAADILTKNLEETDFTARISDGVFALAFQSSDKERASGRIGHLIDMLNSYADDFAKKYNTAFCAGIFGLEVSSASCETAFYNARQGYNYAEKNKLKYAFSSDNMLKKEEKKTRLQRQLMDAVKNNQFKLYMQFVVDGKEGRICGAEALSRWHSPSEGVLAPSNYIEAMQDAGIIQYLDFLIFEEACRQLEELHKAGNESFWISCNFARKTVSQPEFLDTFKAVTDKYDFDRKKLVIELTEDTLVDNQGVAFDNILACRNAGFQIALDDLGSGYTSFSDLCDYPVNIIKVDRQIILKSSSERGAALLKGICRLSHDLGIKLLCEGVENAEEDAFVRSMGCDYIQGYYYSRVYPQYDAMKMYKKSLATNKGLIRRENPRV